MRKKSLYTSAGLHIAVVIAATISIPWLKKDFEIPQPLSVELVDVSKVTETDKPSPVTKPVPKKEEPKEEAPPPKPKPAAKNESDAPVVPVKEEKKEEDKKDDKKVLVDKNAPPDKKKVDKKQETTEKKPTKELSSVLKNLLDDKEGAESAQPDLDPKAKSAPTGQNAPLGKSLTMSEEDALRRQLQGCWNVPFGAKDAENLIVEIFMVINPDRTLQTAKIVNTTRYNSDTFFRAAADSAMRAVKSPNCSPFELPPDKYDTWKETTVTFNPSEMF